MIEIAITMGGLGSRFRNAGYKVPKFMIDVRGKTLFEWSLLSLDNLKGSAQFTFIALKDENADVEAFIREKCNRIGIKSPRIILIDHLTDGQATTALLASKLWKKESPLLIYNIDTYIEKDALKASDFCANGFIPCFNASGTHWSFVKLDESGFAEEVKEKERISDNCTIGAYYFASCELYEKLYKEYYNDSKNLTNGEKYVAPLYNQLIMQGGKVKICLIPAEKVHVLGTPEELKAFGEENDK